MPEKSGAGGWRKRIHSRPTGAKAKAEDRILAEEDTESLRPLLERESWSTFHSRPGTPSRASTPSIFSQDLDDVRRELTPEVPSPRKQPKPKLSRYISGYLAIKDASKEPGFSEPWSETPLPYEEVIDPLVSLQSVFAHMSAVPARPIPLNFNSGIFRIFADYRKVREEKERLEELLHETFNAYRAAEECHEEEKGQYDDEIRRLELLIAHGTSGMAGLVKARQSTIVKRGPTHRKTVSYGNAPNNFANLPTEDLDEQIRLRSQQVLLQRPVSPSTKMAFLSRHFDNAQTESNFTVGTPPSQDKKATLSRKVQSELDLVRLAKTGTNNSIPRSLESGFSGTGDPLPDEVERPPDMVETAVDLEAFVALQELGTLVARKKGIDTNAFLTGLMQLYSLPRKEDISAPPYEAPSEEASTCSLESAVESANTQETPERTIRHAHSQPQLGSAQKRQRHFSFEPGDDQMAPLEEKLRICEMDNSSDSSDSSEGDMAFGRPTVHSPRSMRLDEDTQKPTKIPSPVQRPGLESVRRKGSDSSVRTVRRTTDNDRRDSSSSVLTAFRHSSSGSHRPVTQSRSSSGHTLRSSDGHRSDSVGSPRVRHSIAAMAAARAVDQADKSTSRSNPIQSNAKVPAVGSCARAKDGSEKAQMENVLPLQRP
ncbi:hypothetical protein BU23DRAFT_212293 [Bimuria novae-zelandiae CBS 107.79]|uniref:Uncharacterized protein n=1 Tax=Bimuria novae-zelandiae CBS 107.79 TaxID=1447943 RepID=A0A6A5V2D0_9PLEO|nr:hypothetical protein BU23DRAFT_212293 [Bimuria novae-zelandiae CBS 107.79]